MNDSRYAWVHQLFDKAGGLWPIVFGVFVAGTSYFFWRPDANTADWDMVARFGVAWALAAASVKWSRDAAARSAELAPEMEMIERLAALSPEAWDVLRQVASSRGGMARLRDNDPLVLSLMDEGLLEVAHGGGWLDREPALYRVREWVLPRLRLRVQPAT